MRSSSKSITSSDNPLHVTPTKSQSKPPEINKFNSQKSTTQMAITNPPKAPPPEMTTIKKPQFELDPTPKPRI